MPRKPNKPDHPWKRPFSPRKAAADREKKKLEEAAARDKLAVTGMFPANSTAFKNM